MYREQCSSVVCSGELLLHLNVESFDFSGRRFLFVRVVISFVVGLNLATGDEDRFPSEAHESLACFMGFSENTGTPKFFQAMP